MEATPCLNTTDMSKSVNEACKKLTRKEKYNLRTSSLVSRVQSETKRSLPKQAKPKSRPPPLSKYRRKTANHRERSRMKDMNDAFEALRTAVPEAPESDPKQTKVTTLKLALEYITALRNVLGYSSGQSDTDYASSDCASSSRRSECSSSDISQCDTSTCEQFNSDGESSSRSSCSILSGDESSSNNHHFDLTSPFDLGDDLCIDFDVDEALML